MLFGQNGQSKLNVIGHIKIYCPSSKHVGQYTTPYSV